jgi:hypothetical protein
MNQSLAITLQVPSGLVERDLLILEQEERGAHVGSVSRAQFVEYLGRQLYGTDTENSWQEAIDCGMDGTDCVTAVLAYPYLAALPYQIAATWGMLGERIVQEYTQEEVLELSLANQAATKYPCQEIITARALGDLFDERGVVVPLPSITISGDTVTLSRKVYGKVLVAYRVIRHRYSLRVPRRDLATTAENYYSSVVYAWWAGGVRHVEIEPPPGAEEYAEDEAECGRGQGNSGDDGDDDGPNIPRAAGADRSIIYDYCSGELISDTTYETTSY